MNTQLEQCFDILEKIENRRENEINYPIYVLPKTMLAFIDGARDRVGIGVCEGDLLSALSYIHF